jgi:hypothetical protein
MLKRFEDNLWILTSWVLEGRAFQAPRKAKSTHDQYNRKDHESSPQSSQFFVLSHTHWIGNLWMGQSKSG